MAVHMAAADNVLGGDWCCVILSHMVSWVGPEIELRQFLRIFLTLVPLLSYSRGQQVNLVKSLRCFSSL